MKISLGERVHVTKAEELGEGWEIPGRLQNFPTCDGLSSSVPRRGGCCADPLCRPPAEAFSWGAERPSEAQAVPQGK